MANEAQKSLFTLTPDRENQPGSIRTWKDEVMDELVNELHESRDEFDHRDAQAWEATGQIGLETSGIGHRQAGRILNARAAQHIFEKTIEANQRQREAEEQKRKQERDEEILALIRTSKPDL